MTAATRGARSATATTMADTTTASAPLRPHEKRKRKKVRKTKEEVLPPNTEEEPIYRIKTTSMEKPRRRQHSIKRPSMPSDSNSKAKALSHGWHCATEASNLARLQRT